MTMARHRIENSFPPTGRQVDDNYVALHKSHIDAHLDDTPKLNKLL